MKKHIAILSAAVLAVSSAFAATSTRLDYFVEYIESTGSQWIDTGVCGKSTVNMAVDVMVLGSSGSSCLIGERGGGNDYDAAKGRVMLFIEK